MTAKLTTLAYLQWSKVLIIFSRVKQWTRDANL
jgi:hypothetical protein